MMTSVFAAKCKRELEGTCRRTKCQDGEIRKSNGICGHRRPVCCIQGKKKKG